MEHEREVNAQKGETGTCPYCGSRDYRRIDQDADGDAYFVDCLCECGKEFKETFYLMFQSWEV